MSHAMKLMNLQEQGEAKTLTEANKKINEARAATPEDLRCHFRTSIRFVKGAYVWGWVLK